MSWHDDALGKVLASHRDELRDRVERDHRALAEVELVLSAQREALDFDVQVIDVEPEAVATWRWRSTPADLFSPEYVQGWMKLSHAVESVGGAALATIGIAHVFDLDGIVDLESGFVTEDLLPPADGYESRILDGGLFASLTYGGFSQKGAAYQAMDAWLRANDRVLRGATRERTPLLVGMPAAEGVDPVQPGPDGWPIEILYPITTTRR